jgi:hypothetical protein
LAFSRIATLGPTTKRKDRDCAENGEERNGGDESFRAFLGIQHADLRHDHGVPGFLLGLRASALGRALVSLWL